MAQPNRLTTHCQKCGMPIKYDAPAGADGPALAVQWPALCPKCELVNALLVERYTTHERDPENGN